MSYPFNFFWFACVIVNSLDIMQQPDGDDESVDGDEQEENIDDDASEENAANQDRRGGLLRD